MPIYFEADDLPALGSIVVFSRRHEVTHEEGELQRFALQRIDPHTNKEGEASGICTWSSECMDCEKPYSFTTGLATDAFYRRCKKCRRGKRFTGWPKGPRIKHALIAGDGTAPAVDSDADAPGRAEPRYAALDSGARQVWLKLVKAELGRAASFAQVRAEIERRLCAEALAPDDEEVDPASLF